MEAVMKAINDALTAKDTDIICKKWEIERLQKEIEELKKENAELKKENAELKIDVEKYEENEVNRV